MPSSFPTTLLTSPGALDSWNFPGPGKQTLKIFDGDDAVRRSQFRLITVSRLASAEEVLVRGSSGQVSKPHLPLHVPAPGAPTWLPQPGAPHPPAPAPRPAPH